MLKGSNPKEEIYLSPLKLGGETPPLSIDVKGAEKLGA
jgi:hypothetical protein